jgi:hypothetical protein
MGMTTRRGKGAKLTWNEGDDNFERVGVQSNERLSYVLSPIRIAGGGKITLTNNSNTITGLNFTNPAYNSLLSLGYVIVVYDEIAFKLIINPEETTNTSSTFANFHTAHDKDEQAIDTVWIFPSGEYDAYARIVVLTDSESNNIVLSSESNIQACQNSTVIGKINNIQGEYNRIDGQQNIVDGNSVFIKGDRNNVLFTGGNGHISIIGHQNTYETNSQGFGFIHAFNSSVNVGNQQGNSIFGGNGNNIVPSSGSGFNTMLACDSSQLGTGNIQQVVAIGFKDTQLDFALLHNCVIVPRFMIYEIPVFESDALAGAGGLIAGMAYRNSLGQAFYKLP